MRGRIRARSGDSFNQNAKRVTEFLDQHLEPALKRSTGVYWCRFYRGVLKENKNDAEALVAEGRRLTKDAALQSEVAGGSSATFPKFRQFMTYVAERERPTDPVRPIDAASNAFALLDARHFLAVLLARSGGKRTTTLCL